MARRTASEMIDELALNIGDPEHVKLPEASLLRHLNDASVEIVLLHEPPECTYTFSLTTTPGQRDYFAGTDFTVNQDRPILSIRSVFHMNNGPRLLEIDDMWYRVVNPNGNTSGQPTHWYTLDDVGYIRFYPTPDAQYDIAASYLYRPIELVLSPVPNTSRLNVAWDEVIVAMATSRAFRRLQEWQAAEYWSREANALAGRVRRAITTLNAEAWPIANSRTLGSV